jgi:hypothetical protein
MALRVPYDVNDPAPAAPAKRRKVSPLTWTAGALLIVGMTAGTALAVIPDGASSGVGQVAATAAAPSATATPSRKPKATKSAPPTKATPAPERPLRYTSCNDVWAGGQGPFKEGEPGYTKQLDPDGDGIACESRPK